MCFSKIIQMHRQRWIITKKETNLCHPKFQLPIKILCKIKLPNIFQKSSSITIKWFLSDPNRLWNWSIFSSFATIETKLSLNLPIRPPLKLQHLFYTIVSENPLQKTTKGYFNGHQKITKQLIQTIRLKLLQNGFLQSFQILKFIMNSKITMRITILLFCSMVSWNF